MPDGLVQGHALLVRTPGPSSFLRKRRPLPVDSDAQNFSLLNPKSSLLQTLGISLYQPSSHPRRPGLLSLGDCAQPLPDTQPPATSEPQRVLTRTAGAPNPPSPHMLVLPGLHFTLPFYFLCPRRNSQAPLTRSLQATGNGRGTTVVKGEWEGLSLDPWTSTATHTLSLSLHLFLNSQPPIR